MVTLQDRVELVRSESERLQSYLQTLSPDDWSQPSACDLWTVGDVVGHLVWMADFYGDGIARGVNGDTSTPEGAPVPGSLDGPSLDDFISQRSIALKRQLGNQLLAAFEQRFHWFNDLLAGLGPEDRVKPCYHLNRLREAQEFVVMSLQELTLHGWDIRSSVEPAAGLSNDCLPALIERIPTRRLPWSIPFQTRGASPIRYRFEMRGPGASNQDIVVEAGKARVEPAGPDGANVTIRCDTGIFVLLMYGRLTLESARQDGRLEVQGKPALTSAFDRWLMGG